jgi:hypothetical protein
MKTNFLKKAVLVAAIVFAPALVFAVTPPDPLNKTQVMNKAYRMQIPFIENKGQVGSDEVSFYAKTFGGTLFVGKDGTLTYSFASEDKAGVVIKEIVTENNITVKGIEPSPTKVNYFIGNDQSKWRSNIPSFNSVALGEIYKGIELSLKAYGKNVEKLFTVLPAANPESIKVTLKGAKELKVNDKGELEVLTDHGPITFTKPIAYQEIEGKRVEVDVSYELAGNVKSQNPNDKQIAPMPENTLFQHSIIPPFHDSSSLPPPTSASVQCQGLTPNLTSEYFPLLQYSITPSLQPLPTTPQQQSTSYGFKVAAYDKRHPLIIDPLLASTFIGGYNHDEGFSIAVDGSGNVYVTGHTIYDPVGFYPTTTGAYDEIHNGGTYDVFVSKLDSNLSTLLASTFIGGGFDDYNRFLALDGSGNVYVTGYTTSGNYPTTPGAYDESHTVGGAVFVSKLDSNLGTLLASTFIEGADSDGGTNLALDDSGNLYVTGWTAGAGFPTTGGAYDTIHNGAADVFVSKLDSNLSTLLASTFIGGVNYDTGYSLALDDSGNVYVTGWTASGFPTTGGAYDTSYNGGTYDVIISKLDGNLSTLLASTYIGGSGQDEGVSLTLDGSGNVYVTGYATSGFPTTGGAYDTSYNGGTYDGFVSKLDSSLSTLVASTFIGGGGDDGGNFLTLDGSGNVYVAGFAASGFPTTAGSYEENYNLGSDGYVSRLDSNLSTLLASTFLAGNNNDALNSLALDGSGNVYVTGKSGYSDYPTTPGSYDTSPNPLNNDVVVSKLDKNLLSDTGFTFKTAYTPGGGGFLGSGQFLDISDYLDDPFAYIQCPSSTLTIDFWLTSWSGNNVKSVDYHFTWDTNLFNVESVSSTNPSWTTHTETLNDNVYHLYLESGSGIAGPDIKLHSITLSIKPEAVPRIGRVKAELLPNGYVRDVLTNQYTSIGKTEITIQTICDFPTPTECPEENPCDILDSENICPGEGAAVTEENYSLTPQGVSLYEGNRITVFHTKKGTYTEEVAGAVTDICDSGCFDQCMDNCTYVELQGCSLHCIKGCLNGLCDGWQTEEKCYELRNRATCNVSCFNQCADSYNPLTETSYYSKLCGFSINEPLTLKNAGSPACTGSIKNTYTLTGAGTAGIDITMPFESGTGTYTYDICAGSTFIQRVTVRDGGAKCSLTLLQNALIANQGSNSSINVTLANQSAGGDYDIILKRYQDDAHTIELSVPGSLQDPPLQTVAANGSVAFNINAIDPQAEMGVNNWANVIIKATSGSYSCEAAFDYRVVCQQVDTDSDGTIDCFDNCPTISNPGQEDTFPPEGNYCGNACECEGNFDGNVTVDGLDAATFKSDYGRSGIKRPCITIDPCHGDFICNGNVDGLDAALFKSDFGRSGIKNPCPAHVTDPWCEY